VDQSQLEPERQRELRPKYLVRDTLEILAPSTPVLVRMETLRRATLYARRDPTAAKELLARLHASRHVRRILRPPDALAWFDAGYLAENLQTVDRTTVDACFEGGTESAAGVDGYALSEKGARLARAPPQVETMRKWNLPPR